MRKGILYIVLGFLPLFSFSQEKQEISTIDKILQVNKEPLPNTLPLPIFTLGTGVVSYHGDVMNDEPLNFSVGCNAIHFEMLQTVAPAFKLGIRYLRSEARGNAYYPDIQTYFNFKTEINSFGAFVHYDFSNIPFIAHKSRILCPYMSLGLSFLQRPEARGDWYSNGQQMYLWSDGTFRNCIETASNALESEILYRDYDYETSLQVENQNDKDYYTPLIVSIPIELGLQYNISKIITLQLGYQYHISATNTLDDITSKGTTEARKGSHLPDGYSYAYASMSVNIDKIVNRQRKFTAVDNESYLIDWDADEDGIDETEDECPYTPKGVEVFANGCPLDDDEDGIPNYLDDEPATKAFFHDEKGRGVSEDDVLARIQKGEKLTQEQLYTYYPDLLNGGTLTKQFYKRIPKRFKVCDSDRNDYIDLDELLATINSFFDEGPQAGPGSQMSSKDLTELIEFFFLQ